MLLKEINLVLKMFMNCEIYHQKRRCKIQNKAVNHKLILSVTENKSAFHFFAGRKTAAMGEQNYPISLCIL
ncbi:hypothetical protein AM380_17625 [Morganella morganii]|uniref:Uncharacterized protein n=1 Tax=Morganella morganii TaxID=582 RepID=A0AAU8ZT30_MORMO|nr:hypothetical protein AM380_17625 [Morganella morganii]